MKCVVALVLFLSTAILAQDEPVVEDPQTPDRPLGVVYLVQLLNTPESTDNYSEISNDIPVDESEKLTPSRFILALAPQELPKTEISRDKRSPSYKKGGYGGGGGNYCNVCQGGGGGYPSHGGGGGGGFGGGSSGSWSQASASSGSYGRGYGGGYGK